MVSVFICDLSVFELYFLTDNIFESILWMKLSDTYEVLSASLAIWAAVHAERIVLDVSAGSKCNDSRKSSLYHGRLESNSIYGTFSASFDDAKGASAELVRFLQLVRQATSSEAHRAKSRMQTGAMVVGRRAAVAAALGAQSGAYDPGED